MIFTLIYLGFCIVYHLVWGILMCVFILQVMFEQNDRKRTYQSQKGVKGSKIGQVTRACRSMVLPCRSMRPSSQKPEADMPRHAPFMPQHAKAVQKPNFPSMPQHAKSCRGMAMLIGQCYFWQVGFWDSYVILLYWLV